MLSLAFFYCHGERKHPSVSARWGSNLDRWISRRTVSLCASRPRPQVYDIIGPIYSGYIPFYFRGWVIDNCTFLIPILRLRDYTCIFQRLGVMPICEVLRMKKTWPTARFKPRSEDKNFYEANGLPLC